MKDTLHRRIRIATERNPDALGLVTSEETGAVSLVYNGELTPQEDTVKTEETLRRLLAGEDVRP